MTQEQRTEFAKLLVRKVRDRAIRNQDSQLYGKNLRVPTIKHWRELREAGNIDKYVEAIIADSVDEAIAVFLTALDDKIFSLSFKAANGERVVLDELAGEFCGYFMGEWREEYATERISP